MSRKLKKAAKVLIAAAAVVGVATVVKAKTHKSPVES